MKLSVIERARRYIAGPWPFGCGTRPRQRLPGPAALVCDREDPGSAARTRCGVPGPDLALGIVTGIVTVLAVWTAEADVAAADRHSGGFVHRTHALPCASEKKLKVRCQLGHAFANLYLVLQGAHAANYENKSLFRASHYI